MCGFYLNPGGISTVSPPAQNQEMQLAFTNISACAGGDRGDKLELVAVAECTFTILTCPEKRHLAGCTAVALNGIASFPLCLSACFLPHSVTEAARLP